MSIKKLLLTEIKLSTEIKLTRKFVLIFLLVASLITLHVLGVLDWTNLPRDMSVVTIPDGNPNVYYIQPFGELEEDALLYTAKFLAEDTQKPVRILPPMEMPDEAMGRPNQADAEVLLDLINYQISTPDDCFRIIGLTSDDIYAGDLNFVFGIGSLPGIGCIISYNMLRPVGTDGYFVENLNAEQVVLFKKRIRMILRHELGHTYGLVHCCRLKCVMKFANSVAEADTQGEYYCPHCARLLHLQSMF
jgi:archaemetzincin